MIENIYGLDFYGTWKMTFKEKEELKSLEADEFEVAWMEDNLKHFSSIAGKPNKGTKKEKYLKQQRHAKGRVKELTKTLEELHKKKPSLFL